MTAILPSLPASDTLASRFAAKIDKTDACWLWTGFVDKGGYARIKDGTEHDIVLYAHRYSYEAAKGPIPEGLQIDHLCRVRHCVNPDHLEAVTQRENTLRGESPAAKAARRTHCPKGHPYDTRRPNGARRCSTCDEATEQRRRQRQGAAA